MLASPVPVRVLALAMCCMAVVSSCASAQNQHKPTPTGVARPIPFQEGAPLVIPAAADGEVIRYEIHDGKLVGDATQTAGFQGNMQIYAACESAAADSLTYTVEASGLEFADPENEIRCNNRETGLGFGSVRSDSTVTVTITHVGEGVKDGYLVVIPQ